MSRHLPRSGAPAQSRIIAPFHRGPQAVSPVTSPNAAPPVHAPNAALLIDFDNVTMGIRSDLQQELKSLLSSDIIKGKVAVRRAYADWRRYPQYIVPLTESSIDLIFAPAYGTAKKNATDIRLAIDALELVFTRPEIGTFVLLSGDSDFSSMVIKLKEYGKYVIGVGIRESSSDLLVMNCDEYYSYNALAGLVKTGDDETTRWDPWELVKEAVQRMKRNGDVMRSDRLKQVMQEIDASFDEKNLGMPKFSRFVQDAAHKGLLKVTKLESGQLEVDVPGGDTVVIATDAPVESAEQRRDREERHERDREERRGRRGRRGRGRDRGERTETERLADGDGDAGAIAAPGLDGDVAPMAALPLAAMAIGVVAEPADVTTAAAGEPVAEREVERGRNRRGRGRGRDRGDRPAREESLDDTRVELNVERPEAVAAAAAFTAPTFGSSVADNIGTSGERLTRSEAFDLTRRAVESLVAGDESTSASAARQRAFELLGRNSESLSIRNFERILQDAHDANMIDLRRRGNDFEVARAADAASIVEQLKSVDDAQKATAAAAQALLPQAPRGMGARGVGGRGKGPAAPPAGLLMFGVVGASSSSAASAAAAATASAANGAVVATPAPVAVVAPVAPVAERAPEPVTVVAGKSTAKPSKPAKTAPKAAAKAPTKVAAKAPTKAPAKLAAKTAAKVADKAPKAVAKAPAKKAAKAPAKKTKAK